ncbi:MAG: hypothetical protein DYG98_12995 [Haliscomenobacteraceae bacterium CHB4]|nr:hypothetical protein [Saprospiraceae bacterium]MCE7923967.1 hypothetical protein [Haliscomenobacteraceae bacterium CHB4]
MGINFLNTGDYYAAGGQYDKGRKSGRLHAQAYFRFLRLVVQWCRLIILYSFLVVIVNCYSTIKLPSGFKGDYKSFVPETKTAREWKTKGFMELGKTDFQAVAGVVVFANVEFQDSNYYSINVQKRFIDNKGFLVYFQRDLPLEWIPKELLGKETKEIVTFDEKMRKVIFDLGERQFVYILPKN